MGHNLEYTQCRDVLNNYMVDKLEQVKQEGKNSLEIFTETQQRRWSQQQQTNCIPEKPYHQQWCTVSLKGKIQLIQKLYKQRPRKIFKTVIYYLIKGLQYVLTTVCKIITVCLLKDEMLN